jgi:hypothetical protein
MTKEKLFTDSKGFSFIEIETFFNQKISNYAEISKTCFSRIQTMNHIELK